MFFKSPRCGFKSLLVWVLFAASYGLLGLGLFVFAASFCKDIDISIMNVFQFGEKKDCI